MVFTQHRLSVIVTRLTSCERQTQVSINLHLMVDGVCSHYADACTDGCLPVCHVTDETYTTVRDDIIFPTTIISEDSVCCVEHHLFIKCKETNVLILGINGRYSLSPVARSFGT